MSSQTKASSSSAPLADMSSHLSVQAPRYNLRDYGGYATASGGLLRRGFLLRSGQLDDVAAEHRGLLARLGVGTVIDMRGPSEIPDNLSTAYDDFDGRILLAESPDNLVPHASRDLVEIKSPDQVISQMVDVYRKLPACPRFRESLANYFTALDQAGTEACKPTLVHCYAGKDRTGIAVALLHMVAGVSHDDMFEDYLMTNRMGPERVEMARPAFERNLRGVPPDWLLGTLMAVEADYLAAALAVIAPEGCGPFAYLTQVTGLQEAELRRIAELWVE